MKNFIKKFHALTQSKRLMLAVFIASGFIAAIWDYSRQDLHIESPSLPSPDTYIPPGFVLVPVELQNADALDSLIGGFGVVDLFQSGLESESKPRKVAAQVKILRAPLNPRHFAVLVPENEAPPLVKSSLPFFVVLQNPDSKNTTFPKKKQVSSRIQIEN